MINNFVIQNKLVSLHCKTIENMKNFLLLIGTMFMLVSCAKNSDTVEISKEEYKQLKGDTIKPKYPKPFKLCTEGLNNFEEGIVLGSDQHEYLVIDHNHSSTIVEHYVDCELCVARKESERARLIMDITLPKKTNEQQ
jgi:hypothetical protein